MELSKLVEKHLVGKEDVTDEDYVTTFIQKDFADKFYSEEVQAAIYYYQITGEEMNTSLTPNVEQLVKSLPFNLGGSTCAIEKLMYLEKALKPLQMMSAAKHNESKPTDNTRYIENQLAKINKLQKPFASYAFNNILTSTAQDIIEDVREIGEVTQEYKGSGFEAKCKLNANQVRALYLSKMSFLKPERFKLREEHLAAFTSYIEAQVKSVTQPEGDWSLDELSRQLYSELYGTGISKETKAKLLYSLKTAIEYNSSEYLELVAKMYVTVRNVNFYK